MTTGIAINKVEIDGQSIHLKWTDGHESDFTATFLRINCGCAECVEEWSHRKLLDPATVPADLRAEDYLMVGKYAIQFLWSDTHYTGIYTYQHLRSICTCIACIEERPIQTGG